MGLCHNPLAPPTHPPTHHTHTRGEAGHPRDLVVQTQDDKEVLCAEPCSSPKVVGREQCIRARVHAYAQSHESGEPRGVCHQLSRRKVLPSDTRKREQAHGVRPCTIPRRMHIHTCRSGLQGRVRTTSRIPSPHQYQHCGSLLRHQVAWRVSALPKEQGNAWM